VLSASLSLSLRWQALMLSSRARGGMFAPPWKASPGVPRVGNERKIPAFPRYLKRGRGHHFLSSIPKPSQFFAAVGRLEG
jgi:hypothetical protein